MHTIRFTRLATGLLLAALAAGGVILGQSARSTPQAAPVQAVEPARASTTSASEQYQAWYLRPALDAAGTTSASEQYESWYTRPSGELAGSTTATEQYSAWYLRAAGN
jgi:hypothetical protein